MSNKIYLVILTMLSIFIFSKSSESQSVQAGVYFKTPVLTIAAGEPKFVVFPFPHNEYYDGHHHHHHGLGRPYYFLYTHPFENRWRHERHEKGDKHERHEKGDKHEKHEKGDKHHKHDR